MKSIFQFLQHSEAEVYGLQDPPSAEAARLIDFAAGRLNKEQRKSVCAWLRLHPDHIGEVAEAVKRQRAKPES